MNTHIYSRGENLFDDAAANKVTVGKYVDSNGGIVDSAPLYVGPDTFNYTDYIPVEAGKTYKRTWHGPAFTTAHGMSIAWYKSTKTFISRTSGSTAQVGATDIVDTFTAPQMAAYARINFCSETWPNPNVTMQFYDTAIEWRDYTPNIYAYGTNLFDAATNNVTVGKYITLDGTKGADPNFSYTDYMPVEANKIYKRTWTGPALVQNAGASVAWYDSTKTFIERGASTQYPAGTTRIVDNFTAPANAAYVILNFPSQTWPNPAVDLEFYDTALDWRDGASYIYQGIWK